MKKSLFILIGVLTSLTIQAQENIYVDPVTELKYQYYLDSNDNNAPKAKLVDGRSTAATKVDFILSEFVEDGITYKVTSIGEKAFTTYENKKYTGNTSIEYVIIPEGVTTIEANAFNNCSNIKLLELPSTFTTIGTNAFSGCSRLVYVCCNNTNANLSIPSLLPNNELMSLFVPVGSATDSEGGYLNTATTNKWKERFGDRIYAGKMEIHSSTDSVGMDYVCATGNGSDRKAILYNGDKNRKKVVVPSSFTGDDSKTYNVVGIGRSAFEGSTELDSLIIEDGVITINNLAFQNCKKLRKLTIPSTLRTIGSSAFNECNIKHVWCKVADATILDATKFPNKGMMTLYVSDVDEYSDLDKGKWKAQFSRIFQGDMVSITDSLGNKYVCSTGAKEATLFEGINNDVEIPATITIKNYKVTGIDRGAFQNCTEITKVTIPSSVTAIGSNAFNGCSNLTIVHFKSENPFEIAENVFSSKSKATLFIPQSASYNNIAGWNFQDVEKCDEIERFEYDGMWYIGWKVENDFFAKLIKGKPSIANVPVSVPYSANDYNVTSIGESAFSGIKNIEILDLSLVGLKRIEANAFKNSTDLKRITLPSTLEIIGDKAFNGCNNLVEVESKSSAVIPDINSKNVFPDDDIILYIPSNCTEQQYISKGWNVAHVFLGNRIPYQDENNVNTYVYGSADNTNIVVLLSSTKNDATTKIDSIVTISGAKKTVKAIAKYAFLNRSSINTLTIGDGIKYIGKYAFKGCSGLKKVELPSSLIAIRDYAFDGCSKISIINSGIVNPFEIKEHVFSASISPTIFIPISSLTAYQTQTGWDRFLNNYRLGSAELKEDPNHPGIFYDCYTYEKTATLAKISGDIQTIDVPDSVKIGEVYYTVTDIGESLYKENSANKSSLTKLTISKGIRSIKDNAFQGCTSLETVSLPDSLITIGNSAFESTKIGSITLPKKVNAIGPYAFKGCGSLKTITLSDSLRSIEGFAFQNANQLEVVEIPTKVDSIGMYAFSGCSKLKTVTFSDSLKYIGEYAFNGCSSLTKLIFKDNVKKIGMSAFNGCTNLNWIDLPSKLEIIDQFAFQNCKNLKTIISRIEKDSIFSIDDNVFRFVDKDNISNVSYELYQKATLFVPMPADSVDAYSNETIAEYMSKDGWKEFKNIISGEKGSKTVSGLTYDYLTGPKTATMTAATITDGILNIPGTVQIDTISYKVDSIGASALEYYSDKKSLIKLTIGEGVKSIGANAFKDCTGMTTLSLPKGLKTVGQSAFEGCTSFTDLNIPEEVKTLGLSAFNKCSKIERLQLPSTLTSIGDNAFQACNNVQNIINKVRNPFSISDNVFSSYTAAMYVPIGSKAKYVQKDVWRNFTTIYEGERKEYTLEDLGMSFVCATGDKTAILTGITTTAKDVIVPDSFMITADSTYYKVIAIDKSVCNNNASMESLKIPEKVKTIGTGAFSNCSKLNIVWLPSTLQEIGKNAFSNCKAITHICSSVKSPFDIDPSVFSDYNNPTLFVPDGTTDTYKGKGGWEKFQNIVEGYLVDVPTIDDMTYNRLRNGEGTTATATAILTKSATTTADVVIPSAIKLATDSVSYKVKTISETAFVNNTKLVNLTIPENVDSIGQNAFNGCNKIAVIISKIKKPFAINDNVFSITTPILYVPVGSKADYQKTVGWKNFTTIYEGERKEYTLEEKGMSFVIATGDKAAILTGITTTSKDVIVPDSFMVAADSSYYKVVAVDKSVCNNNTSMESLRIPENVKTIGANAFSNCSKLNMVWLPSTLQEIGEKAFENCKAITHFCIKVESVFEINPNVFSEYSKPTLFVPTGTKTTYNGTGGWEKFSNVVEGYLVDVPTIDDMTYNRLINGKGNATTATAILTKSATTTADVVIPGTIKLDTDTVSYKVNTISESAFMNNTKLVNLTISEYVDSIGQKAFNGCSNIAYIISKVKKPSVINDNVFSITTPTLYVPVGSKADYQKTAGWKNFTTIYEGEKKDTSVVDNGTEYSFECATGDKIAILRGVNTTEENVAIPDSFAVNDSTYYKVIAIEKAALKNKSSIKHLTIPSTIEKIGDSAFDGCNGIEDIVNSLKEPVAINENVFSSYTAAMYVPIGSRIKYEKADGWKNFKTIYEGEKKDMSVVDSGTDFIYECATGDKTAILTGVNTTEEIVAIPDSFAVNDSTYYKVIAIGKAAFKNGSSIRNLTIPVTVSKIGEKAFDGCTNLVVMVSKIKEDSVICNNVVSIPKTSLYVPEGTLDSYTKAGWNFAYIYEGERLETAVDDLHYVCASGEKTAILVRSEVKPENAKIITIPGSITVGDDKYRVIAINDTVFKGNTDIERLIISENVLRIGDKAFQSCSNLKKIELPASLITIGEKAFDGCKLAIYICTKAVAPIEIKENVFSSYSSASLFVPEGTKDSYKEATGWKKFSNFVEGYFVDVLTLNDMVFNLIIKGTGESSENLAILTKSATVNSDVVIPESVELENVQYNVMTIGKSAFNNNSRLVNLTLPESLKVIEYSAFQGCSNMKIVTLPSNLTKIGDKAFDGCSRLAHITNRANTPIELADSCEVFSTSIYETARLYVPSGATTDYKAAEVWNKFVNILVGEMKEVTNDSLTYYCIKGPDVASIAKATKTAAEFTVPAIVKDGDDSYTVTDIESYAFMGINTLEKLTINDSITSIGVGAFQNCGNLKEVVIPARVTAIGEKAFEKCNRLTLVVSHIEKPFVISNDVFPAVSAKLSVPVGSVDLYRKTDGWGNFAMIYEGEMKETEINGMKYLYITGDRTATLVKGSTKEKELTIPSTISVDGVDYSVKSIDESALANASSIEILNISEGIDSIGSKAFMNCANINKVTLPSTLTKIGDNAFSKCDKLVHIETSVKEPISISENVFTETTYANATLYVPVGTSAQYAAAEVWKKFKAMLEGSTSEVKVEGMTYICVPNLKVAKLTKGLDKPSVVKVPSKIYVEGKSYYVVGIERSAFYGLSNLEKVIIPDSVKTIGMEAFKNCSKLNTIELPSTLQSIGEKAFENCSKLTLVVCASATPATIFENTFPANAISINVPLGAKDAYQSANYWGSDNFTIYDSMSSLSEGDETKEEAPATYQIITDDESSSTTLAIVDDVNVSGDFAIPATLVHNGTEYPVTAIAPNTFENNTNLTSVTIPSSINSIGESAFAGCSNLKSIIVNWTEPLNLSAPAAARGLMTRSGGSSIFEGVDKDNCVLYVPDGSVEAYKAAEVWKDFKNIKPISTAAIRDLIINGMPFDVYDLQGRKVRQNVTTLKGLPSGIYIVNGKKVSVRR